MIKKLLGIVNREKRNVVGLMSGTSADGVDAALVEIEGFGLNTKLRPIEFTTYPFPEGVGKRIFQLFSPSCCSVDDICQMNFVIGHVFAEAALSVIKQAQMIPSEVDLIGSHGQTIRHLPKAEKKLRNEEIGECLINGSTLQIGEPAVIAYRTGIVTVGDFRVADVAAGGQGAPLVPYVDFLLLRDREKSRAIQNIGGISNVTVLPAGGGLDDTIAFDTGPGNMMIDETVRIITNGRKSYDHNGQMASQGTPNNYLLQKLLSHPFILRIPPKSTGREEFGVDFVRDLYNEARILKISDLDILATVTAYTAECIYQNYEKFILPRYYISEILVCGGGLHNLTLMDFLRRKFCPIRVRSVEDFGLVSDAKEAVAFAVLANETIHGNPGNVPGATGADRPVILGKIVI